MLPLRVRDASSIALVATSIAACSVDPLRIELPIAAGARSALVLLERVDGGSCGTLVSAHAIDVAIQPATLPFVEDYRAGADLRLTVVTFDRVLEDLGLSPGLVPNLMPSSDQCPSLPASSALARIISDESEGAWSTVSATDPSLRCYCLEVPVPECPLEHERTIVFATGAATVSLTTTVAGSQRILLASTAGAVFEVSRDRMSVNEVAESRPVEPFSMIQDGDNLWIGGPVGRVWRAKLTDRLEVTPLPSTPTLQHIFVLAMAKGALYAFSDRGALDRFGAGRWEHLVDPLSPARSTPVCAALVPLSDGSLAMVHEGTADRVSFYRNGVLTEQIVSGSGVSLCAATWVDGLGLIVADVFGRIYNLEGGEWLSLGDTGFARSIVTLAPYGDGFLFGGEDGFIGRYRRGRGYCFVGSLAPGSVTHISHSGAELYFAGHESPQRMKAAFTIVRDVR